MREGQAMAEQSSKREGRTVQWCLSFHEERGWTGRGRSESSPGWGERRKRHWLCTSLWPKSKLLHFHLTIQISWVESHHRCRRYQQKEGCLSCSRNWGCVKSLFLVWTPHCLKEELSSESCRCFLTSLCVWALKSVNRSWLPLIW